MDDSSVSAFDWRSARIAHRDNLPHVRQENVIYFLTFRLADSLPAACVAEIKESRARWLDRHPPPHTDEMQREYRRLWTVRIELLLDAGYGECVLRESSYREILESCMRHDDDVKYRLGPFVIMPNHVHALVQMLPGHELSKTIKAWKSISARRFGRHLGKPGSYWMDEYFDHAVRGDEPLEKFEHYIRQNPRSQVGGTFTLGSGTLPR